jgi:hypothetical protein
VLRVATAGVGPVAFPLRLFEVRFIHDWECVSMRAGHVGNEGIIAQILRFADGGCGRIGPGGCGQPALYVGAATASHTLS